MANKLKTLFERHLLNEQDDDVLRDRTSDLPRGGSEDFEDTLDQGSDIEDFSVDDLGFDEEATYTDNFANIYEKVNTINNFYVELLDPKNNDNLTRLLAVSDRNDSIANGALQQLRKPILNAAKASQEIKAVLDQIASAEPSLRKKIETMQSV